MAGSHPSARAGQNMRRCPALELFVPTMCDAYPEQLACGAHAITSSVLGASRGAAVLATHVDAYVCSM